jgi:large subunit ribosomal protein L22
MMEAKAVARHVRISPRKARQVVDLIRGKDVDEALAILMVTPKGGSPIVEKVVKSAVANAENNYDMDVDSLYVAECYVDQGPTMKRIRPRARGMANRIRKRTSHITVILREKEE